MANEVDITITARDLTGPAFASALAKMEALKKAAKDTGVAFSEIGVGGFDANKAGAYLTQLKSKIQSLGLADIADVNVPQGKLITQLAVLKRIVQQSGISDLIDMNVNPEALTTQLSKISGMTETIPIKFDLGHMPHVPVVGPTEFIPVKYITSPIRQPSIGSGLNETFNIGVSPSTLAAMNELLNDTYKLNAGFGSLNGMVTKAGQNIWYWGQQTIQATRDAAAFWSQMLPLGAGFASVGEKATAFGNVIKNGVNPYLLGLRVYLNTANAGFASFVSTMVRAGFATNAAIGGSAGGGGGFIGAGAAAAAAGGNARRGAAGFGFWGGILAGTIGGIGLWHVALDLAIESLIVVGTSAAAAAVGIAAMAPAAHNIYDGMTSLYDVSTALNVTIPPLSSKFQTLTKSLAPQVVEDFGGALNLVNTNGTAFSRTAREVTDLTNTWIAKLDIWNQAQNNQGKLLQTGVGFLTQFAGAMGHAIDATSNLLKADPGIAHFLVDIIQGFAAAIDLISKLPAPLLAAVIAAHGIYVWGSVAVGLFSRFPGVIGGVARALAGIPGPTRLAMAAIGLVAFQIVAQWGTASSAIQKTINTINTSLSTMTATQAIASISQDIGQLNTALSGDSTSKILSDWKGVNGIWQEAGDKIHYVGHELAQTVSGNSFMHQLGALGDAVKAVFDPGAAAGGAAVVQLGNDYKVVQDKINSLLGAQATLLRATGTLISGDNNLHLGHLSLIQSFALLDAAGVTAADNYATIMQKVQNLVTGYAALTGGGTPLLNSINAISFATLQQDSHVATLNQGWDTFLATLTGGESGLLQFATDLNTMSTNGLKLGGSMGQFNAAFVTQQQSFQTGVTDANAYIDKLVLLANASGGGQAAVNQLNQGVKDTVALMLPAAKGSATLTTELYGLAQRGGYTGADSFKQLSLWVGNTKDPMSQLNGITGTLTVSAGNLTNDVKNLSVALGQSLNAAMATVITTESGGLKPMEDFYTAVKTTGVNSGTTQTAALNLAKQMLTLTGNIGDAHTEFDTFATQALKLTTQQADTLWNEIQGKLSPAVTNAGDQAQIAAGKIDNNFTKSLQMIGFNIPGVNRDVTNFSNAILATGDTSRNTKSARDILIKDLENAGVQANVAKQMVQNLQGQINQLKGKAVTVGVNATGSGGISIAGQNISGAQVAQILVRGMGAVPGVSGFSAGGQVWGIGGPTSDTVPAMLSPGEFVLNAASANKIGYHNLVKMNRMASGGLVDLSGAVAGRMSQDAGLALAADARKAMAHLQALAAAQRIVPGGVYLGPGGGSYATDISIVLRQFGMPLFLVANWLRQIQTESGGNLNAVNLTDSNARAGHPSVGLLQLIPSTFAAFSGPYRNTPPLVNYGGGPVSENAMAQIYTAIKYADIRYGGAQGMAAVIGHGHGYDNGGWLKPGWNAMYNGTGAYEHLTNDTHGGGVQLEISSSGASRFEQMFLEMIREFVHFKGGGNVQKAFGQMGR